LLPTLGATAFTIVAMTASVIAAGISGIVFTDRDCDGVRQPIEPALGAWKVYLRGQIGGQPPILDSLQTTSEGTYAFDGLSAGEYAVSIEQRAGYLQSTPHSVDYRFTLGDSDVAADQDFSLKVIVTCDTVTTFSCLGGVDDNFSAVNGPEPSSPSAGLLAEMAACGTPLALFDQAASDACFGHTFSNCWGSCGPIKAVITMRLRASSPGSQDDELAFGDWPSPGNIWNVSLGTLIALNTNGADVSWDPGDTMTIMLDLANLPIAVRGITNIMAALQDGDLDLLLRNNTEADFAGGGGDGG
jgi:hypothetical protein